MKTRTIRAMAILLALACTLFSPSELLAGKGGGGKGGGGGGTPVGDAVIAFVDQGDLRGMDADGGNPRTLLSGYGAALPCWSPDGTRLVFTGTRKVRRRTESGLFAADRDGGNAALLTPTSELFARPSWAAVAGNASAEWIVFADDGVGGRSDLFAIRPDGSGRTNLTETAGRSETHPAWEPGAARLAAVVDDYGASRQDILLYGISHASGVPVVVSETNTTNVQGHPLQTFDRAFAFPEWSPVADELAVMWRPLDGGNPDIMVVDLADPSSTRAITSTSGEFENAPTWSPDGSRIAFWRSGTGIVTADATSGGSEAGLLSAGKDPAWRR